jgi:hypothetical protein
VISTDTLPAQGSVVRLHGLTIADCKIAEAAVVTALVCVCVCVRARAHLLLVMTCFMCVWFLYENWSSAVDPERIKKEKCWLRRPETRNLQFKTNGGEGALLPS